MNLQLLNTICFTVSVVCIVLGTVFAISMIWADYSNEFLWKSWGTIAVLFCASALTLLISKMFGSKGASAVS
jgi:hypothetical protein